MPTTIPSRVDSSLLAKYRREGDPVIVVKLLGVGSLSPFDYRGRDVRSYVFRYEPVEQGHILRVPSHLWHENRAAIARDIMEQRGPHMLIVTVEMPAAAPQAVAPAAPAVSVVEPEDTAKQAPVVSSEVVDAPLGVQIAVLVRDKAMRVGDLVTATGRLEADIRETIAAEGSGLVIAGAGWVKLST